MRREPPDRWPGGGPGDEPDDADQPSERYQRADDDTQALGRVSVPNPEVYDEFDDPLGEPPQIDPEELAPLQEAGAAPSPVRRVLPLEDEASHLVARYLFPTERYRGEWKRHIIHLLWPMTIGVLSTFACGWLAGLLFQWDEGAWLTWVMIVLWLGVMGYVAWRVADWHFDRFILTNKRVMKVSGIITRNVAMMPLLRVTDMKYEQTPLGRVLNYGTFVIESAGQDQALREVPHLPNPNELYLRVVEEMYEPAAVEARMGGGESESEEEEKVGGP
ncbi:PH domain-containing protein [Natronosporangium hydrolyticum]|uniref:PH domain-containing protein n=1 Tax=Natronosporangium hydrolyticum TaxID=2811111 RepID=A0A895YJU3_9ACTN|nr:PH domain-containing protein [Natronosporangium hydrolyticum]QSB14068.1 PH domain-containing protein [Natronosporangium hydrolyticum]